MNIIDPFEEHIRDYSTGFIDSISVGPSVAAGLYASGYSKEIILSAIIAEAISGTFSMGLADYIGVDSITERKDIAWLSGLRVGLAFLLGSLIPYHINTLILL